MNTPTFAALPLHCPPGGLSPAWGGPAKVWHASAPTFAALPLHCPPGGLSPAWGGPAKV